MASPKSLSQKVVHPVADGDNTDAGERVGGAPRNVSSGDVSLVAGVCNPVGSTLNTDRGGINAHGIAPAPMRPIPS